MHAALALANVAVNNDINKVAIEGRIAPLVAVAASGTEKQKENAAMALAYLAINANNQVAIAEAGGIAPLVALAASGTEKQKEYAALALASIAFTANNKVAIAEAGGIAPLVALAASGTEKQKEYAALALLHFPDSRSGRGAASGVITVDAHDDEHLSDKEPVPDDKMLEELGTTHARLREAEALALQLQIQLDCERQSAREALERERQSAREAREASLGRRLMALEAQISRTTELLHQVGSPSPRTASDDL